MVKVTMQEYLFPIPFVIFGGITIWIIVFLETYRHFPKMGKQRKIEMCSINATVLAFILMITVYVFMIIILREILK